MLDRHICDVFHCCFSFNNSRFLKVNTFVGGERIQKKIQVLWNVMFCDGVFLFIYPKEGEALGQRMKRSSDCCLVYVTGEAWRTLMMSDRTLTPDSLSGVVLKRSSQFQCLRSLHYLCFCLGNLSAVLYLAASFSSTSPVMEWAAAMIASEGSQ